MYQGSKKITAFGILLLLTIPLIFTLTVLLKQRVLQYHNRERLNTELLQTITVSEQNLTWLKKGKEVIIEGKLFDVKSYKIEGNKVLLTGFFDGKEDKLVQRIKNIHHQKNESDNPINQLIVKFLFFPTYTTNSEILFTGTWKSVSQKYYSFSEKIPEAPYLSIISPPEL